MHESDAHRDSDATPLASVAVCIDETGGKNNYGKTKTYPLSSSVAAKALNKIVTENLTSTYTGEVELKDIVTTIDEREKLLTRR